MILDPQKIASTIREHLCQDILPFWLKHSLDKELGGYLTVLERDGTPSGSKKKVLAHQAWMIDAFTAGATLTRQDSYLEAARHGVRFLADVMFDFDERRWFSVVERDGSPIEEHIRAMDVLAVVRAFSNFAKTANDLETLELALETYRHLELFFWDRSHGGYYDSLDPTWQVAQTSKTFCVHLQAVEALFALRDATGDRSFLEPLKAVADVLLKRVIDDPSLPAIERFNDDWSVETEDPGPQVIYGHMFKAARLLYKAYRRAGNVLYRDSADSQLAVAIANGIDKHAGVFESGNPEGEILDPRHSWWAQCEAIAALARSWAVRENVEHARLMATILDFCLNSFHDKQHGEWFATLDAEGRVLDARKGNKRKSAYPTVRCLIAAITDLEQCKPARFQEKSEA